MHGSDGRGRAKRHLNTGEEMKTAGILFFFLFRDTFLMYSAQKPDSGARPALIMHVSPLLYISPTHPPRHPSTSPPSPHPSSAPITTSSHLLLTLFAATADAASFTLASLSHSFFLPPLFSLKRLLLIHQAATRARSHSFLTVSKSVSEEEEWGVGGKAGR